VSKEAVGAMAQAVMQGQDPSVVSPLAHPVGGLPPILIQVGTAEVIFDDGRRLADAIEEAGGEVTFEAWQDMIHLWHGFPDLPEAQQATAHLAEFVNQCVGTGA